LQQVVRNLIVNAVQAMGAVADGARELLVTAARAEPEGVLVAVKDTGPDPLLHDKTRRFGDGAVDLPFDRRGPWRPHSMRCQHGRST